MLSQWSYRVQIWHAQRKQSELGSILSNFVVILNNLASRRGWTFWRVKFFEFLKKKRVSIRSDTQRERERERESMEWDSEMTQKIAIFEAQPCFWNWNELKFTFSFITTFTSDKIDPKVIGFLLTITMVVINLALLTLAFPKSHKNLLKPTF